MRITVEEFNNYMTENSIILDIMITFLLPYPNHLSNNFNIKFVLKAVFNKKKQDTAYN